jgi:hypothetical protein
VLPLDRVMDTTIITKNVSIVLFLEARTFAVKVVQKAFAYGTLIYAEESGLMI